MSLANPLPVYDVQSFIMDNIQNIFNNFANKSNELSYSKPIFVQYITNPDGNIRWIWPSTSKSPVFLKFYLNQGRRANLISSLIRLIFALRLQRWIFKKVLVHIQERAIGDKINLSNEHWALFTGTAGPNQKYILYQQNPSAGVGSFTKIALSDQSQSLICNERTVIEKLEKEKKICFQFPAILNSHRDTITLEENPAFTQRLSLWCPQHTLFLRSVEKINTKEYLFEDFDQIHQLHSRIKFLKNNRKKLPSGIVKKLHYLFKSLSGTKIKTHQAHVDFTPWNAYSNKNGELYVYDWELSDSDYPKGFDFFHFIIQNGILTQSKSWPVLRKEIDKHKDTVFEDDEFDKYLSLYLLVNTLNNLEIYEKQVKWHTQIHWLLETWNMALSESLYNIVNSRELIILDTFDHLNYSDYSGLKLNDQPEKLSKDSDLDILLTKQTSKMLIQLYKRHPLIQKVQIHSGIAMTKMMILTKSNELLSLDAIHQLKRKSLEYMCVEDLIKRPYIDKDGIKKMDLMDTIQFLGLFYGLNNAGVHEKYRKYEHIISTRNENLDRIINDQFSSGKPNQELLIKEISKLSFNIGISALKNKISYLFDTANNILRQKGMIITFSGVDGAGKSTIIEHTKKEIEKKLRKKVVVIRHRPSLLPILSAWTKGKAEAEMAAASTLPRLGKNKNLLNSLMRFFYYYVDYLFGQFYIYFRYVLRGDIVLYDRYYFDFINDSLRSNITLPKWILKSGYTLLLKPNLNFFLYADAQTILSRKRELNEATINKLTVDYLDLFKSLGRTHSGKYQTIENINLECTMSQISNTIQAKFI